MNHGRKPPAEIRNRTQLAVEGVDVRCATTVKTHVRLRRSLDAFGVHGVGGIIGALLTGVFARTAISKLDLIDGNVEAPVR